MENVILIGLGLILLFVLYKNVGMYKRIKFNKTYVELFNKVLKEDNERAYEDVVEYVNKTENIEFKNKGRIFELYLELAKDLPYEETLNELDFRELFYNGEKVSMEKVGYNSDTFVWIIALFARARKHDKLEIIDAIMAKLKLYEDLLKNYVEYTLCLSVARAIKGEDDLGVAFMRQLIDGDYAKYKYDTRLIGIYKRIATSFLAYTHQELNEDEVNDIRLLAASLVGSFILKDIDMYEEYKPESPKTDDTEELPEEEKAIAENIDNSEEPKEDKE